MAKENDDPPDGRERAGRKVPVQPDHEPRAFDPEGNGFNLRSSAAMRANRWKRPLRPHESPDSKVGSKTPPQSQVRSLSTGCAAATQPGGENTYANSQTQQDGARGLRNNRNRGEEVLERDGGVGRRVYGSFTIPATRVKA